MKKIFSLIFAFSLLTSVIIPSSTVYANEPQADIRNIITVPADLTGKTVILHTNDIHGAISKYALVASVKENFVNRGAEVILADIVTNDFLSSGGDTYYALRSASVSIDTGLIVNEGIIEYVKEALNGVITAEKYGAPRNDHIIIKTGITEKTPAAG